VNGLVAPIEHCLTVAELLTASIFHPEQLLVLLVVVAVVEVQRPLSKIHLDISPVKMLVGRIERCRTVVALLMVFIFRRERLSVLLLAAVAVVLVAVVLAVVLPAVVLRHLPKTHLAMPQVRMSAAPTANCLTVELS
jgi:hypothetical protein